MFGNRLKWNRNSWSLIFFLKIVKSVNQLMWKIGYDPLHTFWDTQIICVWYGFSTKVHYLVNFSSNYIYSFSLLGKSWIYKYANLFHIKRLTFRYKISPSPLNKVHSQCLCDGGFMFPHHTCASCILHKHHSVVELKHASARTISGTYLWVQGD